ncbi:MAG: CotH kinase family protein [Flavobacteriales bacterium]|jgi:hypothetical protein|nr:CotH kinase family protein [Flavobacteriales bacterium]
MQKLITLLSTLLISLFLWGQEDSCVICFSHTGGFHPNSFELTISSQDSVSYYYTLDGRTPNSSSKKYTQPIFIDSTRSLSVVAYKKGKRIAQKTTTFFTDRTFDMGVIAITANPDDFFSYERGIYVKGCCANEDPPYNGANFWKGWERKVNVELYESDGTLAFNQKAGAKIFGGFSKSLPMKSISLTSRKKYEKKYFKYQLFPDKEITKFKSFVLRNSGGDFNKTHFRDALITNLVAPLDIEIQAYRPVVVYINGTYWGIHNLREKITEHFLKFNGNANPDSVDLMKHRNDLQHGNRKQYKALLKYLSRHDLSDTLAVRTLSQLMDIDNFMDYNITQIYADNRDAGGNIRYWKPQDNNSQWRWILFDTDMSFGISDWKGYKTNTLSKMTAKNTEAWPNPAWSTFIIRKLLENDSLKNNYINRFSDRLNTIFTSENVLFKIDSIKALLNDEMPNHVKKWRSNNMKRWERNVNILRDFANYRPTYVRKHLMEKFELTDTIAVTIKHPHPEKGKVFLNSLTISDNFNGYYFKEIPIRLIAQPAFGYDFVEWTGINQTASAYDYQLSEAITITPKFQQKKASSWRQKVVLNELCLKSDPSNLTKDWVELYNHSDTTINISNWKLIIEDSHLYFDDNTFLAPKSYLIVARNPSKINAKSPVYKDSLPQGIPSQNGFIALLDHNLAVVDSFQYDLNKNFKVDSIKTPIILEKVNPNQISNIANWNINTLPTLGERNRAFKTPKAPNINIIDRYWKQIIVGSLALVLILILLIIILRKRHFSKIG